MRQPIAEIRAARLLRSAGLAVGLLVMPPAIATAPAPPKPFPPPDMVVRTADGFVHPMRVWLPPPGTLWRGMILALHGFTDSRDGWEIPAPGFTANGYAVFAPDQRGFGASADRGRWPGVDRIVQDAAEIAAGLRAGHPGTRLVLVGESMGGAVALCLAARPGRVADAYVLLSPAVWSRDEMTIPVRSVLWAARQLAPGWVLTGRAAPGQIIPTDNFDALRRMARDPLTLPGSRVSMLAGLVDLMDRAAAAAPFVHGELLVLSGRRDQVVPPSATAATWARLPSTVRRGFYLNGYHLLLRDQARALPEADILAWLRAPDIWLPSGADINAASWQADQAWEANPSPVAPARQLDGLGQRKVWPF